jgi:hypothetical protein
MKRIFVFNGTVFMSDEKFYAIDLTAVGYKIIVLVRPLDINNYRIKFRLVAGTFKELHTRPAIIYIDEVNPSGILYAFELFTSSVEQCPIEEVSPKDFPLWIGSEYLFYEFENLLKGDHHDHTMKNLSTQ